MIIHNCEQRSAVWFNLRLGKVTGSNAHKLTTPAKFKTYFCELLAETITRTVTEGHLTEAMQWGIDNEPFAAEWYMTHTKQDVEVCGFIEHDTMIAGCSPDLLVGEEGMVQIKCPSSKNHFDYTFNGPDKEIIYQMQWEMYIAERQWNDFVTYDPRVKKQHLIGHTRRIERDEKIIKQLVEAAKEMQDKIEMFLFDNGISATRYVPPEPVPAYTQQDFDKAMYLRV